ncbi:class I SAM-dependent methyltransferase (plasmid) [Bradyrhizobium sp. 155]|uniref:class I SAM-dependent methyltransferase n=1 Tax=unclassified Bradyrhizobium TaxID=2631580 RepID=UPI001FFA0262|nr:MULTISPECIES: class I SAM-dependent methyltransferase [unclassified Bradyrhizobium]MCK1326716.1 class I SAM-dependent methyltransferase [Bradyrhizobium sp. 156]UPK16054.1 class I SAM-dependent methyltransferase [Bradyrhizobium sp. 155]
MHNTEINKIYETYAPLTDQEWRSDLVSSVREPSIRGIAFPSFPSADLQRHLQGNSNEMAIRGALSFRDHCVSVLNANGAPLSKDSILIALEPAGAASRAFMRDVPAADIYAVEPFDFIVEARQANSFVKTDPLPPLPFRDGFATHFVTWSTFSHFNQHYFDRWISEIARVLRPGGICFITTLGIRFLEDLKEAHRKKINGQEIHFWIDLILKRLPRDTIDTAISEVRSGNFFWLPSDSGARSEFAECFVTDRYLSDKFSNLFAVIDYADHGQLAQDCIALRRR